MLSTIRTVLPRILLPVVIALYAGAAAFAEDAAWHVGRLSGDVWITSSETQPVVLTDDAVLEPGDTIHTSRNGRVLLVRGSETILVSANSVVGIPKEQPEQKQEGFSTIIQQAGSILLDVEKRNVQHFEVLTPYLAAVVKGTRFNVTVDNEGSHVEVIRGQVEVTDNKTGQYALINQDQTARVEVHGSAGLALSGSGALSPILQGAPQSSSVSPIAIPSAGFTAPDENDNGAPERRADARSAAADAGSSKRDSGAADARSAASARTDESAAGSDSGLLGWSRRVLGLSGGSDKRDDAWTTRELAVPAVIGVSIAVGAGVMRRRQKRRRRK